MCVMVCKVVNFFVTRQKLFAYTFILYVIFLSFVELRSNGNTIE